MALVGVIDIGSNTIRLVVYDKKRHVSNSGLNSDIISDTENGVLSENGIKKLINAISFLKEKSNGIKILAFGTYAMRVLINKEEVKKRVFDATGINIDILSGKQEAEYDFYGLLDTIDSSESGIGVDLGGGSAQVMIFDNGNIKSLNSYPLGCKQIKNKFAKDLKITEKEHQKIKSYVEFNLQNLKNNKTKKIYVMGGTAKTALKIYSFLTSENRNVIDVKKIPDIINFITDTPPKAVNNIIRNRCDNILVGLIIMEEIAKFFGSEKIHIKKCGVRDGYIYKNFKE